MNPKCGFYLNKKICSSILLLVGIFFLSLGLQAQAPGKMNYQAVARDAESGAELAFETVFVVCKIRSGSVTGSIVYQEEHDNIATNQFGLFNIQIGGGDPSFGIFNQIDWGGSTYWLEIDMDAGSGLETIGAMQFVSVPYALHAETVTMVDDADANPANELITDVLFDPENANLKITEAGVLFETDLTALIDDADANPNNELINTMTFDANNHVLTIEEAGLIHSADLSILANIIASDQIENFTFNENSSELSIVESGESYNVDLSSLTLDSDSTNELISLLSFNPNNYSLTIQEGGMTHTASLSALVNDENNDNDSENELIDGVIFDNATGILTISEAGNTFNTSLSSLRNDADADPANELIENVIFNPTNSVLTISDEGGDFNVNLLPLKNDADADPTNELQTIAQVLTYGGNAGAQRITNLGNPVAAQDAATKNYVDTKSLTGDVDGSLSSTSVVGIQGVDVSSTAPLNGQVLIYNSVSTQWEPSTTAATAMAGIQYYAVDPADFVGMREEDKPDRDNIVIYEDDSEFVTIHKNDESNRIIAPLHLPHNANLSQMNIYFGKTNGANNLTVSLERKILSTGVTSTIRSWTSPPGNVSGSVQTRIENLLTAPVNARTVDNGNYSYRIVVTFDTATDFDEEDDVRVMLYGVRFAYTY